jgi:hypothetical protein
MKINVLYYLKRVEICGKTNNEDTDDTYQIVVTMSDEKKQSIEYKLEPPITRC